MLATVAALVILLGLMVSLARSVRRQASDQFTRQLLARLDVLMRQYRARYQDVPTVTDFVRGPQEQQGEVGAGKTTRPSTSPHLPGDAAAALLPLAADDTLPDEEVLQANAKANNAELVQKFLEPQSVRYPAEYSGLPQSVFAGGRLLDAWGTPIVFMPRLHPAVGIAMENRPFFLSAGPDRAFSTLEDNLYSYEEDVDPATGGAIGGGNPTDGVPPGGGK